jgi:two-component system cell cycle response regulator
MLNDKVGFDQCEIVLKELLVLIRRTIRLDDYIVRWDQDEFLILLHQTALSSSAIVAEKLRKAIEYNGFTEEKYRITVTISATAKNQEQKLYDSIKTVKSGLATAKQSRKNYVIIP